MKWIGMCLTHAIIICYTKKMKGFIIHIRIRIVRLPTSYHLYINLNYLQRLSENHDWIWQFAPQQCVCQDELMLALEVDSTPFRWQDTVDEDDPACRTLVTSSDLGVALMTRTWSNKVKKTAILPVPALAGQFFLKKNLPCHVSYLRLIKTFSWFFQLCHGLTSQVHTAIKPLPGKGSSACLTLVCPSRCH